ncbi:prepilin-type N-terminal cleavage/methylation domain-containing protein [Chamaesiphon sp. VAR_48_metabat_135_sub]|uniref:PilW family protein n=1 Tax=Chamaesiphon sp. VAR_48_metabat_135_sub TaxID=2964699 RepID=UPI00286C7D1F|nr:prepilin-type N-terminal cleavage/methylation domain-containing protein [Chamaesiphon sp. VAR_48_metabat_135_sub]
MAQKYTILKVLLQNSSRVQNSDKGFTLIELIFGLLIMLLVGGFAMNAFIEASTTFNKDKKNIDSSQSLSAIMEIIGNDIKQSGEQINDNGFPVITIEPGGTGMMAGSSKVTVRRALTSSLTLCQTINATSSNTTLVVADNGNGNPACNVGTLVSTVTPVVTRPQTLRDARDYRCKLDDLNANYSVTTSDFCNGNTTESVLAAVSDQNGNMRSFRYINDNEVTANTKYDMAISPSLSSTMTTSAPNTTASYAIGSPIYLIEERVYTLTNTGNLRLQIDRGNPETLIKGIDKFNISAKIYSNTTTRQTSTAPVNACATPNETYSCTYSMASTPLYNWKNIAGVKVELQAKYDATGRAATASTEDTEKLKVQAEFFPRNVLSR